ncbi:hypothetical protein [Candidatus Electronema sp. PJ]|uniref:hypothetical protein n=1 Tax=Candidatus Electronema sp. PJ TaxID=3401572 RepID=UPI003AA99375
MSDEIIDEVRAMREAHAKKFNFDLDAIYEDIKRSEEEHAARGAKFIEPPPATPGIPYSTYQQIRFTHHSAKTAR